MVTTSTPTLSISDILQLISIFAALIPSIIAIVISIITLRQNAKMVEESSRAVLSIYYQVINTGTTCLYLVIKNFGHSVAIIQDFNSDFDFSDAYRFRVPQDYLKSLPGMTLAPGQSYISCIDPDKVAKTVHFKLKYLSCDKTYHDDFSLTLTDASFAPVAKTATENKELKAISYTLQEMLQKNL